MTPRRLRAVAGEVMHRDLKPSNMPVIDRDPLPGARDRVVDVLVELLDARRHSGRG